MPLTHFRLTLRRFLTCGLYIGIAASLPFSRAEAECLSLLSGPLVVEVAGCKQLEPEKLFDTKKDKYSWLDGLDAGGRKSFFDSYRGILVKSKVLMSRVVTKGLQSEEGALAGEVAYMMIAPPTSLQCSAILGKRLSANLKQICCDGSGNVPCLLGTSYLLDQAQLAAKGAASVARTKAKHSVNYQAAETAYSNRKFKIAIKSFEKARVNGELDTTGYYHLGDSYRQIDQCRDALAPLKEVHEQVLKRQVWADEEEDARHAVFLLARCYARLNNPEASTLILSSYLLEPEKYQSEINDSLKHPDFGWIHTSREYVDYEKLARQKLKNVPAYVAPKGT